MLARDWRGGELGILVMALVLAVGVVSGISAFTTRLQSALEQESHRFLAADLVVRSSHEMPAEWLQEAQDAGLATATTLAFPSMVYAAGDSMQLVSVKAVSPAYPLRGELSFSREPFAEPRKVPAGPGPGEVWLDSRLFPLLDVAVDSTVTVGDARFRVSGAVRAEPDQAAGMYGYGPRLLMNYADITATGVVQPGSRVEFRQLYAGEETVLLQHRARLEAQLQPGQRLLDIDQGQPGIGRALQRAESFLLLAGSLGVVLAGVAIALAAGRFSERHNDYVAIMKSLGATAATINLLYGRSLLLLGVVATVLGCLLGWAIQALFFSVFADQLPVQPGAAGARPYLIGSATALTCLVCFAWPPLRRLSLASPLRVLRRDLPLETRRSIGDYLVGLLAVSALMLWYSGDWKLTAAVLAGLAITVGLGMVLALTLLKGGRMVGMSAGSIWRLALAGLQRRGAANALQVVIFAMAIMLLLVLVLVRTSLIDEWQTQLPADAPNHFMINIGPGELQSVEQMLREEGVPSEALYPMIRGRIMAVNDQPLPTREVVEDGPRQRETNFTWSSRLPTGNKLVAGQWWPEGTTEALVSVEREFAERMELDVGDRVSFLVGAQPLEATVASIRELDWQSMRPNFFLVFPPQLLADYPATFMTSFHLAADNKVFLNRFIRSFPTVTVIEMDLVIDQIRSIVNQVSAAVELVLAIILATGALVLVAGVQASVDARMHESSILRALGARRQLILGGLLIEFATLGLFAGVLATVAAELSVAILQLFVLDMNYSLSPWLWPLGLLVGTVLIAGLGVYSCRRVVSSPPVVLLREI
ncbi:FtsX-like permease family protein [Seongchinamella sediminis]|uniref:FtsX-like permease family protein n=2 Tax=Seongchinamella sediminis TaxID=2283635 RepID=A0A3L7E3I4_9GAMM|nr:FtsX-like permease family protein [Seongchinamella sediminis]RLQ23023.1 FtsX-like permease family protein [Seongchinamella sediminis]